jgi:hypothetical protein
VPPHRQYSRIAAIAAAIIAAIPMMAILTSCTAPMMRNDASGWTGVVTLRQIEELRSVDALLPLDPDTIANLYRRYDPETFYAVFGGRITSLALLIDTLNHSLAPSSRIDTLSIDHTFENLGEAAVRGRTLYISSSYFYMYASPEVCRSVVTHEFGHRYYDHLTPRGKQAFDSTWAAMQRSALFYIFRDGEYAGNARFGGHPEENPTELFASAFNLLRNRPAELASRLLFVSDQDRPVTDHVTAIVSITLP